MKNILFLSTLCLTALSITNLNAQEIQKQSTKSSKTQKLMTKSLPFFSASDNDLMTLIGSVPAPYIPLTFLDHQHEHGKGIKPKENGYEFVLDKGSYQVGFTGSFDAVSGDVNLITIALKLGSKIITPYGNQIESGYDSVQLCTICQIVHVEKKTTLSVVANNQTEGSITNVLQRSISIIKLD